jgi:hypothetical protein
MKNTVKDSVKELLTNRYLTVLSGATILLAIVFAVYILIAVRPSDLQLITHYTAYGITNLYRNQWFYLWSFGLFALLAAFLPVAIGIKLYITKGHPLAIMFVWLGFGIIVFAWITAYAIINVWSPL